MNEKKQIGTQTQSPSPVVEEKIPVTTREWRIKRLLFSLIAIIGLGIAFLGYTTYTLHVDKAGEDDYWKKNLDNTLSQEDQAYVDRISKNATEVKTGSYVECIKEINMKMSSYRVTLNLWFKWEGNEDLNMIENFHIYNGTINKVDILKNVHEGNKHYQLARVDVSIFKNFWTKRFPLESHQLRYYIEPTYNMDTVKLVADSENSGTNGSLNVAGYELRQFADGVHTQIYNTTYGQDYMKGKAVTSEYMGQIELNRDGLGLYLKCFIALFGTSLWVFITLFLCTYHRVDPLSMIPAALFGTVSNIMVGANLVPDALEVGLLEFVNTWGVFTILAGALIIININRIRSKYKDLEFAATFGRISFYCLLVLIVAGHILMPMAAYMGA